MRFLVDECTGPGVVRWLRERGHDAEFMAEIDAGATDLSVVERARSERRVLVTNDRDFGGIFFKGEHSHCGVIYLRLRDERTPAKIAAMERVLTGYPERIEGAFVVVTEKLIRFSSSP